MKKLILVTALAAVFAGGAMAEDAAVVNGKVTFLGKVVEQTCSIKQASRDQTIILHTVQKSAFTAQGATAMATPFSIALEKCSAKNYQSNGINKVRLYFSSPNVDTATGTLNNVATTASAAKNVNIQLIDNNVSNTGTIIKLGEAVTNADPAGLIIKDGSNPLDLTDDVSAPVFKYLAQYYAKTEPASITVGDVKTSVDFTIAYE